MTTLTAWSFTMGTSPLLRSGTCVVSGDRTMITCDSRDSYVDPSAALRWGTGVHVTRFPCRVIGRDDQGELRCVPGKPALDYDATEVLWSFARKEALGVTHLWAAPPVVKQYLRTGDPKLQAAAGYATRNAIWPLIGSAAWAATWVTDGGAAWRVASDTAEDAARSAGEATAGGAAWRAARDVAHARQSRRLARMLQAGARRGR